MVRSMTGFGRCKMPVDGMIITVEVKSVNSRYTDITVKCPRLYSAFEERLKQMCCSYLTRGKVEIYLSVELPQGEKVNLAVNRDYLESYLKLLGDIKEQYQPAGEITLSMIAARSDIFVVSKPEDDIEAVWNAVSTVAKNAFENFVDMRLREGERMKQDVLSHLDIIQQKRAMIAARASDAVKESNERMKARISDLLSGVAYDEARLLTECAVFADKADISEELARLDSHIAQFRRALDREDQVGRKLDFMIQEMNREVNTTGSKSTDQVIVSAVIDLKCELEKVREQIQNLE